MRWTHTAEPKAAAKRRAGVLNALDKRRVNPSWDLPETDGVVSLVFPQKAAVPENAPILSLLDLPAPARAGSR
jgi:hypothetical protein